MAKANILTVTNATGAVEHFASKESAVNAMREMGLTRAHARDIAAQALGTTDALEFGDADNRPCTIRAYRDNAEPIATQESDVSAEGSHQDAAPKESEKAEEPAPSLKHTPRAQVRALARARARAQRQPSRLLAGMFQRAAV